MSRSNTIIELFAPATDPEPLTVHKIPGFDRHASQRDSCGMTMTRRLDDFIVRLDPADLHAQEAWSGLIARLRR